MEDPLERSENDVTYFKEQCAAIAEAVSGNKSPFPESYPDAAWPADIVIGIASLKIHDQLFAPAYESVISRWLGKVRNHLDQHGMIPHAVHSLTGKTQEHARGSSQSLMLIFIHEIDSTFGMQQFQLYRKYFLTFRLGIPVMREYPYGTTGHGDVDSGPVVFQAGAAASITGMRTLATYNDQATACALRNATEAFGFAITRNQEKKYLFGMLPMADAFIAWSHAGIAPTSTPDNSSRNRFHLYSVLAAAVVVTLLFYTFQSSFFSKTKVE
ncbi:hypothetical protein [Ohtaekwangia sp.]|uniref:hypothetical protein n=1 Tax=Ohtaekwangia sp. TaxID=2066019 RepID=UPI002FDDB362